MVQFFNFSLYPTPPDENIIQKDLKVILKILTDLPGVLEYFIQRKNCNLLELIIERNSEEPATDYYLLFAQAHIETFYAYSYSVLDFENKINNKDASVSSDQHLALRRIGMTGKSLELKTNLLQRLWNSLGKLKDQTVTGILNFKNSSLRTLFAKFMKCLNSILGSLSKIFPVLDPVKEFKEMLESANDMI